MPKSIDNCRDSYSESTVSCRVGWPQRPSSSCEDIVIGLLLIFVICLPTEQRLYGDISVTLPVGIVCVFLAVLTVIRSQTIIAPSFGFWCLFAFVIWSTCTLAWAEYPSLALAKIIVYWQVIAMTWVITQYAWNRKVRGKLYDAYERRA